MWPILQYINNLLKPFLFLYILVFVGTSGYKIIEKWSYLDAVYMTIITITTVGFGEIHPLSDEGRIFTIFLLLGGVAFYGVAINSIIKGFVDIKFQDFFNRIKMESKINKMKNHFIICGGGRIAHTIGIELEKVGVEFLFIENDPKGVVMANDYKWPILNKNALLEETLIEAGIERASGLASVLQTDADNLFVVLSAKSLNAKLNIITRIEYESTRTKMIQAGATKVISPYTMGGIQIARSFINPQVNDFLEVVLDRASYEFEMKVIQINPKNTNSNLRIRDSNFRQNGYMVIGVKDSRGMMIFAPDADMMLENGFEVVLLGHGKINV